MVWNILSVSSIPTNSYIFKIPMPPYKAFLKVIFKKNEKWNVLVKWFLKKYKLQFETYHPVTQELKQNPIKRNKEMLVDNSYKIKDKSFEISKLTIPSSKNFTWNLQKEKSKR